MTSRQFGAVAMRVLGLGLLAEALMSLTAPINSIDLAMRIGQLDLVSSKVAFLISGVLPVVLLLAFAVAFIFGSEALAKRWFAAGDRVEAVEGNHVDALAFGSVGLLLFGLSIPGLARCAAEMVSPLNRIGDDPGHVDFPWREALGSGVQSVFGLLLFFRARRIASWWKGRSSRAA